MSQADHIKSASDLLHPALFGVPETYCTNEDGLFGEPIKKWMPEGYVREKSPGVIVVRALGYLVLSHTMRYVDMKPDEM